MPVNTKHSIVGSNDADCRAEKATRKEALAGEATESASLMCLKGGSNSQSV